MYPYVTRMYSYVSICYSYVTRMYPCGVLVKIVRSYFRILGAGNMFQWPAVAVVESCREVQIRVNVWTVRQDKMKWPLQRDGGCQWRIVCIQLLHSIKKLKTLSLSLRILSQRRPGGLLNKLIYGEAPARGPTLYPFIYHLSRKRYPLSYTFHLPMVPFTYLVQNFASLLIAVNALSFKQESIRQKQNVFSTL